MSALSVMAMIPEWLVRDQAVRMSENMARLDRLRDQQTVLSGDGMYRFASFVDRL